MSGHLYQRALFADWYAAADFDALPATPITVATPLDEPSRRDGAVVPGLAIERSAQQWR